MDNQSILSQAQTKLMANNAAEMLMEIPSRSIPEVLKEMEDPSESYFNFRRAYLMELKNILLESSLDVKGTCLLSLPGNETKQTLDISLEVSNRLVR